MDIISVTTERSFIQKIRFSSWRPCHQYVYFSIPRTNKPYLPRIADFEALWSYGIG